MALLTPSQEDQDRATIPPDILRRLKAGEQVPGYVMDVRPVMATVGVGDASQEVDTGRTVTRFYKTTGSNTWKSNGDTADVYDENGEFIGVSSGDSTALGLAKFIAGSVGGYYATGAINGAEAAAGAGAGGGGLSAEQAAFLEANAGAGAPASTGTNWGAVASAGNKAGMTNAGMTAVRGGDLGDIGRAYGTGFVSGGAGNFGGQMGWSPVATSAGVSGGMTLANGGTVEDAARSAGGSAFNTYLNTNGLTGNATADRVIGRVGSGVIRTGEVDGRAVAGGVVDGLLAQGNNKQSSAGGDEGGDAFDEAAVQGGSGRDGMTDDTDDLLEQYGNDAIAARDSYGAGSDAVTNQLLNDLLTDGGVTFNTTTTDPRTGVRGSDGYGVDGMTGAETTAFDNALNSFDIGKLPDWLKTIGSALGISGNDGWKMLFGGLNTAYLANKNAGLSADNRAFITSERLGAQDYKTNERLGSQEFITGRDKNNQTFTTSERLGSEDFITKTNQTKRNWTIEDRDELRKWNAEQQQAEWDRMLPVSYRPMELKVIPGTKAAAGTMAGNNGYASTIDVVGDLSYATDPNRKRGLLG